MVRKIRLSKIDATESERAKIESILIDHGIVTENQVRVKRDSRNMSRMAKNNETAKSGFAERS